jgi:hypothetical protein
VVGVLVALLGGAGALGVGQQRDQRWLVRDEDSDVLGVLGDERERVHRTAAAGEDVDRATDLGDERVQVRRVQVGGALGPAVLAPAAADAARVVEDDRPVREVLGHGVEALGRHRVARHHQRRLAVGGGQRSRYVVHEVDVGGLERVGLLLHGLHPSGAPRL